MTIATRTTQLSGAALIAGALILGSNIAASAQSQYADGPNGARPHALRIAKAHRTRVGYRPLTVARRAAPPLVIAAPAPVAGPGTIVTGPLGVASNLAAMPFRVLNGIFPADGPPPVNFIGAPIAAAGTLVQTPFQIMAMPFGGPAV